MAGILAAAWQGIKGFLFTSEFAKSPVSGVIVGAILLLLKSYYDQRKARQCLLAALTTEAETAWNIVNDLLERFPTKADADEIVNGVRLGNLSFETLNKVPAGWLLSPPSFPLADTISKLKPAQAVAAVDYFDAWARLVERERRLTMVYMKLVDLTPFLADEKHRMQLMEVAYQLRGNLGKMLAAAKGLANARHVLEYIAGNKRSEELDINTLKWPRDWGPAAKDEPAQIERPGTP